MVARKPARRRGPRKSRVRAPGARDAEIEALRARIDVLYAALGLPDGARRGDRGKVGDLGEAVVRIQDYLLRTSERLDHILSTLKNHRELLVRMNQRMYNVGTRERIRMELDIMKNTVSLLALNGVELEDALVAEMEKVRKSTAKEDVQVADLRKAKEALDKRFDAALGRFDLSTIYRARNRGIPGYR